MASALHKQTLSLLSYPLPQLYHLFFTSSHTIPLLHCRIQLPLLPTLVQGSLLLLHKVCHRIDNRGRYVSIEAITTNWQRSLFVCIQLLHDFHLWHNVLIIGTMAAYNAQVAFFPCKPVVHALHEWGGREIMWV